MNASVISPTLKKFNEYLGKGIMCAKPKEFFEDIGWIVLYSDRDTTLKRVPDGSRLRSTFEIKPYFDHTYVKYSVLDPLDGKIREGEFLKKPYDALDHITLLISAVIEPVISGCTNIPELKSIYKKYMIKPKTKAK